MNPSLNTLRVGESALVSHIEAEPAMRRRLLELGLVPGTRVTCAAVSPAGDPAAYLIRGAKPLPGENVYPNERLGFGILCLEDSFPL